MKKILSLVLAAGIMTSASAMEKSFVQKATDVATNPYVYVPTLAVLTLATAAALDICYNDSAICDAVLKFFKNIPGYTVRGGKTSFNAVVDLAKAYPVAFVSAVSALTIGGAVTTDILLAENFDGSYTGKGYNKVAGLFKKEVKETEGKKDTTEENKEV
ncbi:hypothetical protein KJ644_03545 [Candidatus Dependentiae bacterium]|nr:hypothetical protein [Candidatus Dependentiae bacterium]MBU4387521.1 hypothetical protein [Candidatus Dependentiae bacterium]MCG2756556.1 hypothetical protein [Candidatus Dependentiae bacterium]